MARVEQFRVKGAFSSLLDGPESIAVSLEGEPLSSLSGALASLMERLVCLASVSLATSASMSGVLTLVRVSWWCHLGKPPAQRMWAENQTRTVPPSNQPPRRAASIARGPRVCLPNNRLAYLETGSENQSYS